MLLAGALVAPSRPAAAEPGCSDVQPATRVDGVGTPVPHADGKYTPIVLVHGFISSPAIWSKPTVYSSHTEERPNVKRSLLGNLQALPGAIVYTVDYHDTATRWFTEPGAGGAVFTHVFDCITGEARYAGHNVVVAAHSMGGLIARWSVTDAPGAAARRARMGLAITVGTPYEGAWLAALGSFLVDTAANIATGVVKAEAAPLLELMHLAMAACREHEVAALDPCTYLNKVIEFLASMHAFAPGSPELSSLSPWPKGMRVETLASSSVVQDVGGLFLVRGPGTVDLGDVVVGRASATSGGHQSHVAECRYTTAKLTDDVNNFLEPFGMRLDSDPAKLVGLRPLGACFHIHESVLLDHTSEILSAIAEELQRYSLELTPKAVGRIAVGGSGTAAEEMLRQVLGKPDRTQDSKGCELVSPPEPRRYLSWGALTVTLAPTGGAGRLVGWSVGNGKTPPGLRLPHGVTTSTTVRDAMRTIPGATAEWDDVFGMYSIRTDREPEMMWSGDHQDGSGKISFITNTFEPCE
ncbi:hypothetical protein GCM10022255_011350 [Dactylosporangium darangshiense]|uniref:Uncharacterized protein n=1 Tax=Dactylosporangium darangshiense TaxID=579108 RepID=A0ABP8CZ26_9ACTN